MNLNTMKTYPKNQKAFDLASYRFGAEASEDIHLNDNLALFIQRFPWMLYRYPWIKDRYPNLLKQKRKNKCNPQFH